MELKTLTLSQLEQAIDEYEEAKARYKEARARKEAAEADLKEARERIVKAFKEGGIRYFNDSKGRIITIDTRYTEHIPVKEARVLLDPDIYRAFIY